MHGLAVTFVRCSAIERDRLRQVLLCADAFFVERSEPELRRDETFFGRDFQPAGCFLVVLRNVARRIGKTYTLCFISCGRISR